MQALNFPAISAATRTTNGRTEIFDPVRKIYIALTPEEWVRQHLVHYLMNDRLVPAGLIAIEKKIVVNKLSKRYDVVVYKPDGTPVMIVECKAPSVKISSETFNQALRYNLALNIRFLLLTNGLTHFCFMLDYENQSSSLMDRIPNFDLLCAS